MLRQTTAPARHVIEHVPGFVQGAQANLNDTKGAQPRDNATSGSPPALETAEAPPQTHEGPAATDAQAANLNMVKDGLSKVSV